MAKLLPEGIASPEGFDIDTFSSILLTFSTVDYANKFFDKTFPDIVDNYSDKFKILKAFFNFEMVGGYRPDGQSKEDEIRADYLFTLQHLLNKVKVLGIEGVVK